MANAKATVLQKGMGGDCAATDVVKVGDTVAWTNYYDRVYQVTSVDANDHLDGNFDSGLISPDGIFTRIFDDVGDFLYYCSIPHQTHAMIKVIPNAGSQTESLLLPTSDDPKLTGRSSDGSLVVDMKSDEPKQGEKMSLLIGFAGKYGEPVSDIDYTISVSQDETWLPIEFYQRQSDGKISYNVYSLISDSPVMIKIDLLGVGHPHELSYLNITKGETIILQTNGKVSPVQPTNPIANNMTKIPLWIKTNAKSWSEGKINDLSFSQGIHFMINNGIINITKPDLGQSDNPKIPNWIKNTVAWWTEEKILESEFIAEIQYLVEHQIIRI